LVISNVSVNNLNVPFTVRPILGQIVIGFGNTINITATINVHLKFTPFLDQTIFPSQVISKRTPDNPQRVDAVTNANGVSWTLIALGVPDQVIVSAKADPNPFTPNGDGRNDVTFISFFVSNLIVERPVTINIFDVTGRLVRSLLDTKSTAQAYVEQNAIRWDGRDINGRLLPPGLYIYQIKVDVDGLSPAVVTKTVSIAY
jgi:gliding motility-associated-like protein